MKSSAMIFSERGHTILFISNGKRYIYKKYIKALVFICYKSYTVDAVYSMQLVKITQGYTH